MNLITLEEFQKELVRIDVMQNRISEIFGMSRFWRWWYWSELIETQSEVESALETLYSKELVKR